VFDAEDNDIVRATVLGHLELNCELEVMPTCTATPHHGINKTRHRDH